MIKTFEKKYTEDEFYDHEDYQTDLYNLYKKNDKDIYFRFQNTSDIFNEESYETEIYAQALEESYEAYGMDGIPDQYERISEERYRAKGVNAFDSPTHISDVPWQNNRSSAGQYINYQYVIAFEGENLGTNYAGDGDIIKPTKQIAVIPLDKHYDEHYD